MENTIARRGWRVWAGIAIMLPFGLVCLIGVLFSIYLSFRALKLAEYGLATVTLCFAGLGGWTLRRLWRRVRAYYLGQALPFTRPSAWEVLQLAAVLLVLAFLAYNCVNYVRWAQR